LAVTHEHEVGVRGAHLCKASKGGAAAFVMPSAGVKAGPAPKASKGGAAALFMPSAGIKAGPAPPIHSSNSCDHIGETMIKPDVIVKLKLYPEGGRKNPTPPDHLSCILEYEKENFECRLLLEEVGSLSPGALTRVPLKFLRPDLIKERLHIGDRFRLREAKYIGEGIFEQILV